MPLLLISTVGSITWYDKGHVGPLATILRTMTVVLLLLMNLNHSAADEHNSGPADTLNHWFVVKFDGMPVGYEHVQSRRLDESGEVTKLCRRKTQLNLKRMGQDLTLRASLHTKQTLDGVLLSFSLQRVDGAGARTERSGELNRDRSVLHIEEKVNATRREFDLRVKGDVWSPVFSEWLPRAMQNSPDRIVVPVVFPESASIADIAAIHEQSRKLRVGNAKPVQALRIRFYPRSAPTNSTTLYVSESAAGGRGGSAGKLRLTPGIPDRTDTDATALTVLRQEKMILGGKLTLDAATASEALSAATEKSLDLTVKGLVPVNRVFSNNNRTPLVLVLSVARGFLPTIPEATFQKVELINDSTARVTLLPSTDQRQGTLQVSRVRPPLPPATHWMPLQDSTLQRMAVVASAGQTDPRDVCRRVVTFVHSKIQYSPFSTSLSPADEVARTLRGDCTEHAVLLAALMRIRGIPSRVVSGMIHTKQQLGFSGHTWVEALIGSEWIPFDSTIGATESGATHLKLADSEMPDAMNSGISLFLPVLDLAGRAEIRIISDR
ncbi:MAG: transglutaminase-like domain-containing protein [Fuerstiella sp.]|nr:transglutaminase-like domain-containing protein [Fuerstiella sp.]